jgi:L-ascorbate metabolism protein UlaG (beta-lactamase superfamily)
MRLWLVVAFSLMGTFPPAADRLPAAGGDIEITPLIHASVQIEHAGKVIQVDPWSAADLSRVKAADLILITDRDGTVLFGEDSAQHGHHLDVKAIERLRKPGAPVIIPHVGKSKVPDGIVLANGESKTVAGVRIDATPAHDIYGTGVPISHKKGEANGYVVTIGGKRLFFSGVTECVPEIRALKNIDVAFLPMNIPHGRMTPGALAECVKAFKPKVVYVYHYDATRAERVAISGFVPPAYFGIPGGLSIAETLKAFQDALSGESIEVRIRDLYPESVR